MYIKRKLTTLNNKTGEKILEQISSMLSAHEKYKSCYMWSSSGSSASQRRYQEFSSSLVFTLNGIEYKWLQGLEITCKNYYWISVIFKNDAKSNITTMKKIRNKYEV